VNRPQPAQPSLQRESYSAAPPGANHSIVYGVDGRLLSALRTEARRTSGNRHPGGQAACAKDHSRHRALRQSRIVTGQRSCQWRCAGTRTGQSSSGSWRSDHRL